jgi:hypothetical protein
MTSRRSLMASLLVLLALSVPPVLVGEDRKPEPAPVVAEHCVGKVCFPEKVTFGDWTVHLRGAGKASWMTFDVYTAALWAEEDAKTPDDILKADEPKRLVLHYHRSVKREDIISSTMKMLEKRKDLDLAALRPRLDKLHEALVSVDRGDEYAITWMPGRGLEVALNGRVLVTVEGDDFGAPYLGIWLGDPPISESLRRKLLGPLKK